MIVTVTANPSVDISLEVETLDVGEVNRCLSTVREPGGKGINVSRALALNGVDTAALFPADVVTGRWLNAVLTHRGVDTLTATIEHEVRHNIAIADAQGITTNLNDPGPEVTTEEADTLRAEVVAVLESRPTWLVAAGSLPPGLGNDFYVQLGELAHERGVRFACDTSGSSLRRVAESGVADFLKPNLEELQELGGRELVRVVDVVDVCRQYLATDAEVVVSLGAQGALLVTHDATLWANHEPVTVESTVGAGDSCVAGYLAADLRARNNRLDPADARQIRLTTAVTWGAAAVKLPGTGLPGPEMMTPERVQIVREPDPQIRLEDLTI